MQIEILFRKSRDVLKCYCYACNYMIPYKSQGMFQADVINPIFDTNRTGWESKINQVEAGLISCIC